jgi:hypothetical protein
VLFLGLVAQASACGPGLFFILGAAPLISERAGFDFLRFFLLLWELLSEAVRSWVFLFSIFYFPIFPHVILSEAKDLNEPSSQHSSLLLFHRTVKLNRTCRVKPISS